MLGRRRRLRQAARCAADGTRFVRLILGRGGLFGDRPYGSKAFRGYASPQHEQAVAHGPAEVFEVDREELEAASQAQPELATLLLESATTRFNSSIAGCSGSSPRRSGPGWRPPSGT